MSKRLLKEIFAVSEATPISQAQRELDSAQSVLGGPRTEPGVRKQQDRSKRWTPSTATAQSDIDTARSVKTEVTVNVPDEDMPGLQRAVLAAIKAGDLPKSAVKWARSAESAAADAAKDAEKAARSKKKDEPEAPPAKAEPKRTEPKASGTAKTAPQVPAAKAEPKKGPPPRRFEPDDNWFPSFPQPKPAAQQLEPEEEPYVSPWSRFGGGSSWEDVPDWMRDPEKMPVPGSAKGSQRVPRSPEEPEGEPYRGPSPVGKPWSQKDVGKMGKRPGFLSRLFGGGKR